MESVNEPAQHPGPIRTVPHACGLCTRDAGRDGSVAVDGSTFGSDGTSATIGTTSVVHGTFMADQSIAIQTGATLDGRALARIGAVTLDTNMIVKPTL